MAKVTRAALKHKSRYSWRRSKGDTAATGHDAVMFNRKEGYEVLSMIQQVAKTVALDTQDDFDRIEDLIANELPGNIRARKRVHDWLVAGLREGGETKPAQANIEHVVVLMLENRSFDNVLGWLYEQEVHEQLNFVPPHTEPVFRGLTQATVRKYVNKYTNPDDKEVYKLPPRRGAQPNVIRGVRYANSPVSDPHEPFEHVTKQIYDKAEATGTPSMKGFLDDYSTKIWSLKDFFRTAKARRDAVAEIMDTHTPEELPILNGLARRFGVSDEWYCSVPTQTNPNRAFMACGTSLGQINNEGDYDQGYFDTETIWNVLHDGGVSWKIFWETEFPPYLPPIQTKRTNRSWTELAFPRAQKVANPQSFPRMAEFHRLARTGRLPYFSFIEPAWTLEARKFGTHASPTGLIGIQGHDCHPPGDVRPGEAFVGEVYNSLIACDETWNKTLLIITFDEHGGTFDHWPPPTGATPPDDTELAGFPFDRFGVRVPTLFVSPYVRPQTVVRAAASVPFDHTSIAASMIHWKNLERNRLGQRTENAPTFESVLEDSPVHTSPILGSPVSAETAIGLGESFHLQYASSEPESYYNGLYVASADNDDLEPTLSRNLDDAVPLQFTLGLPPTGDFDLPTPPQVVGHGSAVHLHTAESGSRVSGDVRDLSVDNHYSSSIGGYCYYRSARDISNGDTWSEWTVHRVEQPPGALGQPITYGCLIYLTLHNPVNASTWLPGKLVPWERFHKWPAGPTPYYLILAGDAKYADPSVGQWKIVKA